MTAGFFALELRGIPAAMRTGGEPCLGGGDARERRHIQLIIVGYTAPVRQPDRLDPHFEKRRRVEKISAAQNRPASRFGQTENLDSQGRIYS
jgi:hypothetical protein